MSRDSDGDTTGPAVEPAGGSQEETAGGGPEETAGGGPAEATGGGPAEETGEGPEDAAGDHVEDPPVEELTSGTQRLDPRVRVSWGLRMATVAVVLGAIVGVAGAFATVGPWPGILLAAVAFALGVAHTTARYRTWRFEVRHDDLYLERGVLTRVTTVVPHVRIQHVDARRGPMERALGLSSVVVFTAGSRGADVTVPGLTHERAEDLQTRLKQLAIAAEGDDAV